MSVTTDTRFAIVPEWVLFHPDLSANAVRLYAVLMRYANTEGDAWPSRKTLAERMRCSLDTIDRLNRELVKVGALTITQRTDLDGDLTSNHYHVAMLPRSRESAATPLLMDAATGGRTDAAVMRTTVNDNQLNEKDSVSHETAVEKLPTPFEVLDLGCQVLGIEARSYGPELPKQLNVVKRMLAAGHAPADITGCLGWLWSNEFRRRNGIDFFDVEKAMARYVSSAAPAPLPKISDIKSSALRTLLAMKPEDFDDCPGPLSAQDDGPRYLDAGPRRLGPGDQAPQRNLLHGAARSQP